MQKKWDWEQTEKMFHSETFSLSIQASGGHGFQLHLQLSIISDICSLHFEKRIQIPETSIDKTSRSRTVQSSWWVQSWISRKLPWRCNIFSSPKLKIERLTGFSIKCFCLILFYWWCRTRSSSERYWGNKKRTESNNNSVHLLLYFS